MSTVVARRRNAARLIATKLDYWLTHVEWKFYHDEPDEIAEAPLSGLKAPPRSVYHGYGSRKNFLNIGRGGRLKMDGDPNMRGLSRFSPESSPAASPVKSEQRTVEPPQTSPAAAQEAAAARLKNRRGSVSAPGGTEATEWKDNAPEAK